MAGSERRQMLALLVSEQREWLRLMLDAEWYG